jgi:hypothetical protein
MSETNLLSKIEALIRKHRGSDPDESTTQSERPQPDDNAWLPILTDVLQRGTAPASSQPNAVESDSPASQVFDGSSSKEVKDDTPQTASTAPPESAETITSHSDSPKEVDAAAEAKNLVDELTPKISSLMREQVADELRKSLDQSMASLMANLNVNVEEIVRQAVAEKLAEKDNKPS